MREEYYERLSQLLFSSLWQYEIPDDGDYLYYKWEKSIMNDWVSYCFLVCDQMMVIICIINERRVLWMTESVTVSSLWQYEIPDDGDYLYYKWEKSIMNDWVSYCFLVCDQMMVIICIINERRVLWMTESVTVF